MTQTLGQVETARMFFGDEAVAVAAIDAGVGAVYSYPGTPATEIMQTVLDLAPPGVVTAWTRRPAV
jgi:TPP-dependent indolepyruvate ferredoxin oxidoreductase alpha subunit